MTYFRETNLSQYATYCGIAVAFVCTTAGSLGAQELKSSVQKQDNTILSASTLLSSGQDNSTYPKSESLVVEQTTNKNNIFPDFNSNTSKRINYSSTSVDLLPLKSLKSREIKPSITIAQQPPAEPALTETIPQTTIPQASTQNSGKNSQKSRDSENPSTLPSRFYIGPDFFHRNYSEEEINPGFKSDEFGTLYGVQATYDYVKGNSIYFGLGFRYGGGKTTYDGSLQDGTPAKSKTENSFLNLEGRLGYTFQPGGRKGRLLLSPFVGLGYHHWSRNIAGGTVTTATEQIPVSDLSEGYSWGYVGPGFHAEYKVSRKFDIGLNAKLMFMFGNSFDLESKFQGTVTDQGNGNLGNNLQYEIELPLTFHLVDKPKTGIDLKIVPYYRSQDIGRGPLFSTTSGESVLEPASNTSVYGVTAGIQFRF